MSLHQLVLTCGNHPKAILHSFVRLLLFTRRSFFHMWFCNVEMDKRDNDHAVIMILSYRKRKGLYWFLTPFEFVMSEY